MNKMLVAIFNDEDKAYQGLSALKDLHKDGDISLYATAVLVKDALGEVSVKQSAEEGPVGSMLGLLSGSLVGMLAGPAGVLAGASVGGLTGALFDLRKAGIDVEFVQEVTEKLEPGHTVVLADLQEGWQVPVDTRLSEYDAIVFRRMRSELEEEQIARESEQTKQELAALKQEVKETNAEYKEKLDADIKRLNLKLELLNERADAKIKEAEKETAERVDKLESQIVNANKKNKEKLSQRVEQVKESDKKRQKILLDAIHANQESLGL